MRNRAVTDVFEPGSSVKPLTVAAALEAGLVTPASLVNTSPGYLRVDGFTIRDEHNYGMIDVTTILTKSSNVGASKLALRSEEHTSELQSLMRNSYAVFCLKKKKIN